MDRSARNRAHARATTFSLGLWHVAMSLETPRHGVQLELSRARLVQSAEHLVFSDYPCGCYAHRGPVSDCLATVWSVGSGAAIYHHIFGHGRDARHARLHA